MEEYMKSYGRNTQKDLHGKLNDGFWALEGSQRLLEIVHES